jgi:hypothetical protein
MGSDLEFVRTERVEVEVEPAPPENQPPYDFKEA